MTLHCYLYVGGGGGGGGGPSQKFLFFKAHRRRDFKKRFDNLDCCGGVVPTTT